MSRSKVSGPFAGAYVSETYVVNTIAASQTDQIIGVFTCPFTHFRPVRVVFRVTGTGGLTAFKVRKKGSDADVIVAASDTQLLSADGGVLAAATHVNIEAVGTTPTFVTPTNENDPSLRNADSGVPLQNRDLVKGDQVGFFITSDATVGNRNVWVDFCGYSLGQVLKEQATGEVLGVMQYD